MKLLLRITLVLIVLTGGTGVVAAVTGSAERRAAAIATAPPASAVETTEPASSTTEAPPPAPLAPSTTARPTTTTTTRPVTTTTVRRLARPATVSVGPWSVAPYRGLGAWLDVYDWSATFTNNRPQISTADIDRMARLGVRTIYLQTARPDTPEDVLEPARLRPLIARAQAQKMAVVAWFLPDLSDPTADLRHLLAASRLGVDGLGVDIESRSVTPVAERNRRLVALSAALRKALPGKTLSAIVLPPVVMEDVNPNYWPGFPWMGIAPYFDVWMPMAYFTNRNDGWRDAYKYTAVDVQRVRHHIRQPHALVHTVGGIANEMTVADVKGMRRAAVNTGCIGLSLYDYRTTGPKIWAALTAGS